MIRAWTISLILLCVLGATPAVAATKCVDSSTGSDATTYADNNGTTVCWQTLGRAVWGSSNRATPNASEAAAAGDTVYVAGGTYDTTVNLGSRNLTAYTTANDGTNGNPIVFRCVGICTLTGAEVEGVLLGQGDDYIHWRADLSLGYRWVVSVCSEATSAGTDCPSSGVATAVADYPPIACINATGMYLEGFYITGAQPTYYEDNWNGMRMEGCQNSTIRNVRIRDITQRDSPGGADDSNHNQSCLTIYHSRGNTIEHVDCANTGAGVYWKDTATASPVLENNIVRYSLFDNAGECFAFSIVTGTSESGENHIYQNICKNSGYGVRIIGSATDGPNDDIIANNTFYNLSVGGFAFGDTAGSGIRAWNNLYIDAPIGIVAEGTTMPADTVIDLEHDGFHTITNFYNGSDGNRTLAGFTGAYTDQELATPAGEETDPIVVDAAGGDFRLCTGSGTPDAGCSGASPAINQGVDLLDLDGDGSTVDTINAGAYLTGNETIGLESVGAGASAPVRLRISGADAPQ